MPITETTTYCCKKWVNEELKKYYSRTPCSGGAVQCSDPDPQKPPDGDGGGINCRERCEEERRGAQRRPGKRPGDAEENYRRCMARCGDEPPPPPPPKCEDNEVWDPKQNKCVPSAGKKEECLKREGYRWDYKTGTCVKIIIDPRCDPPWYWDPEKKKCVIDPEGKDPCLYGRGYKNAEYQKDLPCDKGWHPKVDDAGEKWCCPDKDKPPPPPPPPGSPCSGEGHELPFGTSQCEEGFSIKKADDGKYWCCKDVDVEECDPGWHWDDDLQKCVIDTESNCPEGTHWSEYAEECVDDEECDFGYHWDKDQGECVKNNGDGGGEFEWGEGLQGLLGRIQERANYLLDYPRGLTPQERQGVINYAIESVKSGERGRLQSSQDLMARRGLLGSGFEFEEAGRIKRETRASETQIRRELAIDDMDRRFSELMGTTGMAQSLTGTLMQGEQIPEILSGARRSEGQASINSLLALLGGSAQGQGNQYWTALLQELMGRQGSQTGGIWDWLPWLLANRSGSRQGI